MSGVGFTGTRNILPPTQVQGLFQELSFLIEPGNQAHSGDCVGADAKFHEIARKLGARTIGHIPLNNKLRAFCTYHEERAPLDYLARNRAIVDEVDVMVACPKETSHQERGGTWYTINYTIKQKKPVVIVWPNGAVKREWTIL